MFRIDELIVYREYEQDQDQVLNDMAFIVEETETMGMPVSDLRGLYFSCIHKLTELAGTYGFEGNLWHSYLTWLLVNNENVFSHASEIRGEVDGSINALVEHDYEILSVAESLYRKFDLKRVFYSAFVKVNEDKDLPALQGGPPLLREHRLYQADWLLRFYGFEAGELLSEKNPDFNLFLDPKADWALRHLEQFPVEVNCASYEELLRVPGIGVKSARRIVQARRSSRLEYQHLKKIGVVLKRAIYFITCNGRQMYPLRIEENFITRQLLGIRENLPFEKDGVTYQQLSLFDDRNFGYDGKQLVQPESAWRGAAG